MSINHLEERPAAPTALAETGPVTSSTLAPDLTSSAFIAVARALSERARGLGLIVPAFRTPPRTPGLDRALRRWPGGGATVSVRRTGLPARDVLDSMVEGVLAAGRLPVATRDRVRPILRQAAWSAAGLRPPVHDAPTLVPAAGGTGEHVTPPVRPLAPPAQAA